MSSSVVPSPKVVFYILERVAAAEEETLDPADQQRQNSITTCETPKWIPLLAIPDNWIATLPIRPRLAVIQYALYCITGLEGDLWLLDERPDEGQQLRVDQLDGQSGVFSYYFHYRSPTDEPSFIPQIVLDDRAFTSTSARQSILQTQVLQRDSSRCVVIEVGVHLNRAHLLPHSSGDATIQLLSSARARSSCDVIDQIDDQRNGLLVYSSVHEAISDKNIAFLPIPSFCMDLPRDFDLTGLLGACSPDVAELPFSVTAPAVCLLTMPGLPEPYPMLGLRQGRRCRIFPGRASTSQAQQGEARSNDQAKHKHPDIWILDILLGMFFYRHFRHEDSESWVESQSRNLNDQIVSANARDSRREHEHEANSPEQSLDSSAGPETPQKRRKTGSHGRDKCDSYGWNTFDNNFLLALASMPNPEAVAVHRAAAEAAKKDAAEQAANKSEVMNAWLGEQQQQQRESS